MSESRKEFEERMTRTYPLLYSDMYGDPRDTCMAFGFDVGPGWYPILEELSSKIEPLARQEYNRSVKEQIYCAYCGNSRRWHWIYTTYYIIIFFFMNKGKAIKLLPQRLKRVIELKKSRWETEVSIWKEILFMLFRYKWYRPCKRFQFSYPRAAQIKEKFAGLRYYMTWETDEIDQLIEEAEIKAARTCETCGEPGEWRDGGWQVTLCDKCNEERK